MTAPPRRLIQPGPPSAERLDCHVGQGMTLDFRPEPGRTLLDAVAAPLRAAGLRAAGVTLHGGSFAALSYVLPAPAPDATHVAFYSQIFRPEGKVALETACITFGERDGAPWLHCHAIWTGPDGVRRCGHVLPDETQLAVPPQGRAWGWSDIAIRVEPDSETNFPLFRPAAPARPEAAPPRLAAARIRPNEDAVEALESLCRRAGFAGCMVRGSLGSTVGAEFEDGRLVEGVATELLVLGGGVTPDPAGGGVRGFLDVALTDMRGRLHEGRLARGRNPVCITFELALEEMGGGSSGQG